MGESGGIKFRGAINGYNKDDVNKYIGEMNRRIIEAEEKLRQAEAAPPDGASERIIAALREELTEKDAANAALGEEITALKSKLDECSAILDTGEDDAKKARLYEKMSSQIGDLIIQANEAAEAIIGEAKRKAEDVKTRSDDKARELFGKTGGALSDMTGQSLAEFDRYAAEIGTLTEEFIAHMRDKSYKLGEAVEKSGAFIRERIAEEYDAIIKGEETTAD